MSKSQDTSRKIPKLRFREFQGEWTTEIMRKLTTLITNGFVGKATDHYVEENGVLYIQGYNVHETGFDFHGIKFVSSEFHLKNKKSILREGDLLTIQTGDVGVTGYVTSELTGSNCHALIISRYKDGMAHSKFYHQYFNSHIGRGVLKTIETGSTMKHLNCGDMEKLNLPYTSFEEQQKIASFLTTVDEKIEKLKTRKSLFEKYKKGVMQKIFSREIRFRDENGKEFREWEEKELSTIGDTFNGLTGKTKDDFGSGMKYITYKQIFDSSIINSNKCEKVAISEGENQNQVQYGDFFFTISSETPDEIGMSSVLLEQLESCYLNSFCFGFRIFSLKTLDPLFGSFLFRSKDFRRKIVQLAQGSTRYNMSKVQFLKIRIALPSILEQQKIASFLSEIDKKIDTVNREIESVEKWKKGLLQQMFV